MRNKKIIKLCTWGNKIFIEKFLNKFIKKKNLELNKNKFAFDFEIFIEKSKRRTVSLIIKEGRLFFKCPFQIKDDEINEILKKKNKWIQKKINFQKNRIKELKKKINENIILFKGEEKAVKFIKNEKNKILLNETEIIIFCNSEKSANLALTKWLKIEAHYFIENRVNRLSSKTKIDFDKLEVKELRTKWGACYFNKRNIVINWRLIMAPISVINYVIIHELCHLIQPDHSKYFWREVRRFKPDYNQDRLWLKEKGYLVLNLGASERI